MYASMKCLIILSCLSLSTLAWPTYTPYQTYQVHAGYHGPPAPLAHDGRVVDTPEVAHAKKAHLVTHAEEAAKTSHFGSGYIGHDDYSGHHGAIIGHGDNYAYHGAYHGPSAPIGHDGRVVDTPEVAHAKAAHLATHAEEASKTAHLSYPTYSHAHW